MATHNNNLLNLKANDGAVWVREQDNQDSQPVIRLWTQDSEVIVPASSLLASSLMLRQILSSGDFLPVQYHAPVVILPSVTVNVAKHVMNLVTTGKTDTNDPEVIKNIKETLEMLKIPVSLNWVGNVGSYGGNSKHSHGADAGIFYNANSVKTEEEVEYFIKIEFDDNSIQDVNENLTIPSETYNLAGKKNVRKQNLHQDINTARQDCNVQIYNDDDEASKLSEYHGNKRRVSRRLSTKNANKYQNDRITVVPNPTEATASQKILKNRKLSKIATKVDKKVTKPLQCNLCGVGFNSKNGLQKHIYVHNALYACDQCDHKAESPSSLMKHRKGKHTTDMPYRCDKCDYKSGWLVGLFRHKCVVHEGRSYDCNQCSFKGKWRKSLVVHIQLTHEDTVYHCNKCSYKSKAEPYLKKHKVRCHERD